MSANHFHTDIPDAVITDVMTKLGEINTALNPYKVVISEADKKHMPKIADKTLAFAQKTDGYMDTNPQFNAPFVDVAETHKDFQNYNKVHPVIEQVVKLSLDIQNIGIAAGSDAFTQYLGYYGSVHKASDQGIPGAKAIYDELAKRFPGHKKPLPPVTP